MLAGSSYDSAVEFFVFIIVQDKGFIKPGSFHQAGISDFWKFLQCQQYFMAHAKSNLVVVCLVIEKNHLTNYVKMGSSKKPARFSGRWTTRK